MQQYMDFSRIYDDMIDVDYDSWGNFIEEFLKEKEIDIRGKWALEIGCGTGNMTTRLRSKGFEVMAFDISEDMLSLAEEKARKKRQRITFLNQDAHNFKIDKKFDFVFSFCDVYNYITEEKDIGESFINAYKHLKDNAYFIFDISTPYKLKEVIGNKSFSMNSDDYCYIWDNYIDNDIIEMYISFFIKEGKMYKRVNENHIQRAWEIESIKKYLLSSGFREIEVYNDYSFDIIKGDSLRAVFIAKK